VEHRQIARVVLLNAYIRLGSHVLRMQGDFHALLLS
jgi:hypothetical protein